MSKNAGSHAPSAALNLVGRTRAGVNNVSLLLRLS